MSKVDLAAFEAQRPRLFAIAYRMLGSAADAEDMVQETFLRYQDAAAAEDIRSLPAYLTTIISRLCINHMQSARVQRETYIGPWLPEPIPTPDSTPQALLERQESISLAFLVLLESLTPAERAVFILREVFDYGYDEIASMLGNTPAACRKLFSRARTHIQAHGPRFSPSDEQHHALFSQFIAAMETGDTTHLAQVLTADAVIWTDGGGRVTAAPYPIRGRAAAITFIMRTARLLDAQARLSIERINGAPALLIRHADGRPQLVIALQLDAAGMVGRVNVIANPEKLTRF